MRIIIVAIFVLYAAFVKGQHFPLVSQYMVNELVINPAYAGSRGAFSITASYRNQWAGIKGAPTSYNIGFHGPLKNEKNAIGLILSRDEIGVSGENILLANYAYRISTPKSIFSIGLAGGVSFMKTNWSILQMNDEDDPAFQSDILSYMLPQFSIGALFESEHLFAGISAPMIRMYSMNKSIQQFRSVNKFSWNNFMLRGGYILFPASDLTITPSFLFKVLPNSSSQIDINATVEYKQFLGIGASYRSQDALVSIVQFKVNRQLAVGYSYDATLSELRQFNSGSHEIFIRYDLKYNIDASDPRFF